MTDLIKAEMDLASARVADQLANDLWVESPSGARMLVEGNADGTPTWVGRCDRCGLVQVTNLNPQRYDVFPKSATCGHGMEPMFLFGGANLAACTGTVRLCPDWEARLAAYLIGGLQAASCG